MHKIKQILISHSYSCKEGQPANLLKNSVVIGLTKPFINSLAEEAQGKITKISIPKRDVSLNAEQDTNYCFISSIYAAPKEFLYLYGECSQFYVCFPTLGKYQLSQCSMIREFLITYWEGNHEGNTTQPLVVTPRTLLQWRMYTQKESTH